MVSLPTLTLWKENVICETGVKLVTKKLYSKVLQLVWLLMTNNLNGDSYWF